MIPCDVTANWGEYKRTVLESQRSVLIDWNDFGVSSAVQAGQPAKSTNQGFMIKEKSRITSQVHESKIHDKGEVCHLVGQRHPENLMVAPEVGIAFSSDPWGNVAFLGDFQGKLVYVVFRFLENLQ
ncbi:hypothetical protein AVEN_151624-1 [Araneus ventricosus]|uniref:Uncharacterized protein n=1 Tax=Araneus ventricosus TaxID=182803 RepID=A0A4Y2L4S8_ARAVE|nr:hypothetical protein AVEN_151624-1 [Araneus ventricosus]